MNFSHFTAQEIISDSTIMPECIICKTRNVQIVIPKNEDLRKISLGLHFCILTDVRVVKN